MDPVRSEKWSRLVIAKYAMGRAWSSELYNCRQTRRDGYYVIFAISIHQVYVGVNHLKKPVRDRAC